MKIISYLLTAAVSVGITYFVMREPTQSSAAPQEFALQSDTAAVVPTTLAAPSEPTVSTPSTPSASADLPAFLKPVNSVSSRAWDYTGMINGEITGVQTNACSAGILVDITNKKVLWGKRCKLPAHIASMTKMMTTLLVIEDIDNGKLDLNTVIPVSRSAAAIGGSQAYLDVRESFTVDSLLEALIVHSANDCAQLLAEHLGGGTRDAFIQRMNSRAKELGMRTAKFYNPHGLPAPKNPQPGDGDNLASPADMAIIAEHLLYHPKAMAYAKQEWMTFTSPFRKEANRFRNSNWRILNTVPGTDGMKTGLSGKAGQCVTVSCLRNGRRMIAVVMGVKDRDARTKAVKSLLDWGYAQH